MPAMLVDFLRHGEPVGGRMYRGCGVDHPLSPTGWTQMRRAVAGLDGWQLVVSSPMCRCLDFAEELSRERDLPLRVEPDLREMAFGAWEGLTPEVLMATDPHAYRAYLEDPASGLPQGAEPPEELSHRVVAALDSAIAALPAGRDRPAHLLVVAHGGVIRAALAWALGLPPANLYRLHLDYAGMSRLCLEPGRSPRLLSFGPPPG